MTNVFIESIEYVTPWSSSVIYPFAIINLARYLMCNINLGSPRTKESISIVRIKLTKSLDNLRVIWSESPETPLLLGREPGLLHEAPGIRIPV